MKRKLLSTLLALSMLLAVLPVSALALEAEEAEEADAAAEEIAGTADEDAAGQAAPDSADGSSEAAQEDSSSETARQPDGPSTSATGFSDVPDDYAFAEDIAFAVSRGWMSGDDDGAFNPKAFATRQSLWMALAIIDGAAPADMEAAKEWAKANGLTDGTRAEENMSRQRMLAILYQYAELKGYDLDGGVDIDIFPDAALVSEYAKEPLSWAIGNGIIQGASNGLLYPAVETSRGHLAAFLHRFADALDL